MRYDDRAEHYARTRPGYPPALRDALLANGHLHPDDVVADIGSGTGLLTELLLGAGCRVYAVEPSAKMREQADARFAGEPRFVSVDGRAERTTLPDASVDLVAVGQAFHWFDPAAARAEFLRILQPPRRMLLVWNVRNEEASEFMAGYEALLRAHATDPSGVSGHRPDEKSMRHCYGAAPPAPLFFPHHQIFDLEGLKGRLLSSSFLPAPHEPAGRVMIEALERLFAAHQKNGHVRFDYETHAYAGTMTS